ncbi:MAG: hypothetical protein QXG40_04365 [Ignisphaera sp.]
MRKVLGLGLVLIGGYLVYRFFISSKEEVTGGRLAFQPVSPKEAITAPGALKQQYEKFTMKIPPALLRAMIETKKPIEEG